MSEVEENDLIETVVYKIKIPVADQVEGLPTKLNKFLKEMGYEFEIVDSEGFEQ